MEVVKAMGVPTTAADGISVAVDVVVLLLLLLPRSGRCERMGAFPVLELSSVALGETADCWTGVPLTWVLAVDEAAALF